MAAELEAYSPGATPRALPAPVPGTVPPRADTTALTDLETALLRRPAYTPPVRRPMPPAPERVPLMGIEIDGVTQRQALDRIFASLEWQAGGWVVTPNLEILRQCRTDPEVRAYARAADLVLADGQPLVWGSRIAGTPLPERVAGSDLVVPLARMAARAGRSMFLLGGNPGVADQAAVKLRELAPGLLVAGTHCPPFGFENDAEALQCIERELAEAQPDIVLVALGAPKQERLIAHLRPMFPRTWFLGVGITLSFVTGDVERAPTVLRKAGLEWVHRLLQEPGRLASRYLRHGLPFAVRLGLWAARRRVARTPR